VVLQDVLDSFEHTAIFKKTFKIGLNVLEELCVLG
jgi:hypothetical protein